MVKGIIFDYNGTLFFDDDINYNAWKQIYFEIVGNYIDFERLYIEYLGKRNSVFLNGIYKNANIPFDEELINIQSYKKETKYHEVCIKEKRNELAPGAKEFIEYVLNKGLKINIATASIKYNLDFYFEKCNLGRYFTKELIAYDDGIVKSKKEMYTIACRNIGLDPSECISIDDTESSINSSIDAGINRVIRINYANKPKLNIKEIVYEIKDFKHIDYSKIDSLLI